MKQLFLSTLFGLSLLFAQEEYAPENFKVTFDADGDGKVDTIEYTIQKTDTRNAEVKVKIYPTRAKPLTFTSGSNLNYEISRCKQKECIKIFDADYGIWAEDTTSYYVYDRLKRSWFLKKSVLEMPTFDEYGGVIPMKRERVVYNYEMSERIDGEVFPNFAAHPLHALEKKAKDMPERFSNSVNIKYLRYYVENYPISKKTVTLYNNIAFYLSKHEFNDEAIYILEKIVELFPNRVVAYLNLGDAYFAEENEAYKKMYERYIKLMKERGKESRIPERIYDR